MFSGGQIISSLFKKKKFSKAHVIQKLKVLTMLQLKAIERYNNDDTIKHRDLIVYIQMRI